MRYRCFVLTVVILIVALAINRVYAKEPALLADGEPVQAELEVVGNTHIYSFVPNTSTTHTIIAESYQSLLAVWVMEEDGTPIQVAIPVKEGQYRYQLELELKQAQRYFIGIGVTSSGPSPIRYQLAVYSITNAFLPLDPSINFIKLTSQSHATFTFEKSNALYLGHPARFFELDLQNQEKRWIHARVSSETFIPNIRMFDLSNHSIVSKGWYNRRKKTGESTAFAKDGGIGIIVYARDFFSDVDAVGLGTFQLHIESEELDPNRPIMTRIREFVLNPFIGFLAGIIATAFFSYLFYIRSVARKQLCYELHSDRLILHSEMKRKSRLRVFRNKDPVTDHIGVCSVELRLRSHRDITSQDIRQPIRLSFAEISSILRVTADATGGWRGIMIPVGSQTSVEFDIDHLEPNDYIYLNVFYTQKESSKIEISASGRIQDGSINKWSNSIDFWRIRGGVTYLILYAITFLVALLDSWFNYLPARNLKPEAWIIEWWFVPWLLYFVTGENVRKVVLKWYRRTVRAKSKNREVKHFEVEPESTNQ